MGGTNVVENAGGSTIDGGVAEGSLTTRRTETIAISGKGRSKTIGLVEFADVIEED